MQFDAVLIQPRRADSVAQGFMSDWQMELVTVGTEPAELLAMRA